MVLGAAQRRRFKKLAGTVSAPFDQVRRARILLDAADGRWGPAALGRRHSVHADTVRRLCARFAVDGEAALVDRPRSGRPRRYGADARLAVLAAVTETAPEAASQWSHRLLAEHLAPTVGMSPAQIGRVLADLDLKPHRVRGWLNRPADPDFTDRAAAVCDLYLHPPADGVVISVDEKTAIQARSRRHPTRPVCSGSPEKREFEYVRHDTVSLVAAMDVATGQVLGEIIPGKNNSANFTWFLTRLDEAIDPALRIYLVMDNGSSHTARATRAWLAAHPRFVVTYTPKHASWLNMVEIFFSTLTRQLLRRGDFTSRDDLAEKILHFIEVHDRTARPYRWTYTGEPLKAA
ncbi:IS630 family transposase [Parafrankia elaeagni]|uniref:IS630 family transposase n=1 Tax=Parafrankia elaeagni TaxID=222534 RepID=UPI00037F3960|nr:IS630 family transposase [Parafrankia elaeagni]